jgi:cation diffusion facilitator CzcD-associated flavoprotein CzcO
VTQRDSQVVVIGAGPYGLSVAANLLAGDVPTLVFGRPMEFWKGMPRGMLLRSSWSASSFASLGRRFDLDHYVEATRASLTRPLPLEDFIRYGLWYQGQLVRHVDETYVRQVEVNGSGFEVELQDGRTLRAGQVVVAIGISSFARVPEFARELPRELATHSQEHANLGVFLGKSVAVVGGGQSALECAALLHEVGAQVELLARREIIWLRFNDSPSRTRRLAHAPSDVGPPGLSWLIHFGSLFRRLPEKVRNRVADRATRPAGARWLRDRVIGKVPLTETVSVVRAQPRGDRLRLELSDGTERLVDHLVLGTGYRPQVERLSFLGANVRRRLEVCDGFPRLTGGFESSIPGLYFVGRLADRSHGPICRFVSGAEPTARRVAAAICRSM